MPLRQAEVRVTGDTLFAAHQPFQTARMCNLNLSAHMGFPKSTHRPAPTATKKCPQYELASRVLTVTRTASQRSSSQSTVFCSSVRRHPPRLMLSCCRCRYGHLTTSLPTYSGHEKYYLINSKNFKKPITGNRYSVIHNLKFQTQNRQFIREITKIYPVGRCVSDPRTGTRPPQPLKLHSVVNTIVKNQPVRRRGCWTPEPGSTCL